MRYLTERACFHNGRYYEADSIVECDCKFCKEGSVPYFKKVDEKGEVIEEENVSQETKFAEAVEKADEKLEEIKEEPKEEVKPKKRNKIEIV